MLRRPLSRRDSASWLNTGLWCSPEIGIHLADGMNFENISFLVYFDISQDIKTEEALSSLLMHRAHTLTGEQNERADEEPDMVMKR